MSTQKTFSFDITDNHVMVFTGDGAPKMVSNEKKEYKQIVELLVQEDPSLNGKILDLIRTANEIIKEAIATEKLSDTLEIKGGKLFYMGRYEVPAAGTRKVMDLYKQGFKIGRVVKFIENMMENPSQDSIRQLSNFLEVGKLPIDPDGYFLAYKAIRNDWKSIYCGTIDNSIGQKPRVPRWTVDADPSRTCSTGLHVCTFDYLRHFAHSDGRIVVVRVNPKDVVTVPADYNGTKMRVCEYEVMEENHTFYKDNPECILSKTAFYSKFCFAVQVRNNDEEEFETVMASENLSEMVDLYASTEAYQVRVLNQLDNEELESKTNEALLVKPEVDACEEDPEDFECSEDIEDVEKRTLFVYGKRKKEPKVHITTYNLHVEDMGEVEDLITKVTKDQLGSNFTKLKFVVMDSNSEVILKKSVKIS